MGDRQGSRSEPPRVTSAQVSKALRILIALLVVAAIGVALIPLLVILDIREGGDGWGLCAGRLEGCRTSYFAGFELVAALMVALFGLLALIGGCARLLRVIERRHGGRHMGSDAGT